MDRPTLQEGGLRCQRKPLHTPLPPGHICLLRRHADGALSDGGDSYQLVTFPTEDCPAYEAISYCWGKEASSEPCFLKFNDNGGGCLLITPHLKEGLKSAFVVFDSQRLWVDAICITQGNDVEKAQQAEQMGRLFENAKNVIVWLGPDYEGSESVMEMMPLLSSPQVLELVKVSSRIDWAALQTLGVPACEDPFWVSLVDLLHRPWFERL